jgi:hypothetical protein
MTTMIVVVAALGKAMSLWYLRSKKEEQHHTIDLKCTSLFRASVAFVPVLHISNS